MQKLRRLLELVVGTIEGTVVFILTVAVLSWAVGIGYVIGRLLWRFHK